MIKFLKYSYEWFWFEFLTYSTARRASIKSFRLGIIYRIGHLVILGYIIGYKFDFYPSLNNIYIYNIYNIYRYK